MAEERFEDAGSTFRTTSIQKYSMDNQELSCTSIEEPDTNGKQLLWNLDVSALLRLRKYFQKLDDDNSEEVPLDETEQHREKRTLYIDLTTFENAITTVFGHSKYTAEVTKLFKFLDHDKSGYIWWEELLDELVEYGEKKTQFSLEEWVPLNKEKIIITELQHCKKESIIFIITIETEHSFCYVIISWHGKIGIYDGNFLLLMEYDVFFVRTGIMRRVRDIWITAAMYLEDSKNLIIAGSDRSLMIYDASTLCHVPIFLITGLVNVPTCFAYNSSENKSQKSHLVIGNDHGGLTIVTFKQPRVGLFHKVIQDKLNALYWIDLQSLLHEPYCEIKTHRRVHVRSVKKIIYVKHNDTIMSCSNDPSVSLIIKHRKGIRDPYVFKVPRGISCFHYSESLGLIATGSSDGQIRLWEPVVTNKPSAIFQKQNFSIIDLVILAHADSLISFNKNGLLKVWDISNCVCIQSAYVRFPSFGILGKLIQFGSQSLFCGPGRKKCANEKVTQMPTKRMVSIPDTSRRSSKMFAEDGGILRFETPPEEESKAHTVNRKISESGQLEYSKWSRSEIVVTCCNYLAIVPINPCPLKLQETVIINCNETASLLANNYPVLPPPEKTHRPRKPSIWDSDQYDTDDRVNSGNSRVDIELTLPISTEFEKLAIPENDMKDLTDNGIPNDGFSENTIEKILERAGLSGIMEKDFLEKFCVKHDINTKLALQKDKQEKMRLQVAQGAPYSALDLQDPQEIQFSVPLPLSSRMQKKSGLEYFTEPQHILRHNSCFSMATPRTNYSTSSRATRNSGVSEISMMFDQNSSRVD